MQSKNIKRFLKFIKKKKNYFNFFFYKNIKSGVEPGTNGYGWVCKCADGFKAGPNGVCVKYNKKNSFFFFFL
jgi:hypothetical protein